MSGIRKRHYKILDDKQWAMIKALSDAKMPWRKIESLTGRSRTTIARISKHATFGEYKINQRDELNRSKLKRGIIKVIPGSGVPVGPMNKEIHQKSLFDNESKLDGQAVKILIEINNNILKLIEISAKKKGFFL